MPRQFSHVGGLVASNAQVLSVQVAWLSHIESTSVTSVHKRPRALFLFLPALFLLAVAVAPWRFGGALSDRSRWWPDFSAMSWYSDPIGYVCRRCWLIWLYFEIFVVINWCTRVLKIMECLTFDNEVRVELCCSYLFSTLMLQFRVK
jgi:hypothetical protein